MSNNRNIGGRKLLGVLDARTREHDTGLVLDFGTIRSDGSLVTDTFPVPIAKNDYSICKSFTGLILGTSTRQEHSHSVTLPKIKAGDRVLVAWVQNEPTVIDAITKADRAL